MTANTTHEFKRRTNYWNKMNCATFVQNRNWEYNFVWQIVTFDHCCGVQSCKRVCSYDSFKYHFRLNVCVELWLAKLINVTANSFTKQFIQLIRYRKSTKKHRMPWTALSWSWCKGSWIGKSSLHEFNYPINLFISYLLFIFCPFSSIHIFLFLFYIYFKLTIWHFINSVHSFSWISKYIWI